MSPVCWFRIAVISRQITAERDLGAPCACPLLAHRNLRWVLLHMIEETAGHVGHADIIRETLDGSRGIQQSRGPCPCTLPLIRTVQLASPGECQVNAEHPACAERTVPDRGQDFPCKPLFPRYPADRRHRIMAPKCAGPGVGALVPNRKRVDVSVGLIPGNE
jgi:hypothetical protein